MTIMSSHKPQTVREMPSFLILSSAVKSVGSGGWLQSGFGCVRKGGGARAGVRWWWRRASGGVEEACMCLCLRNKWETQSSKVKEELFKRRLLSFAKYTISWPRAQLGSFNHVGLTKGVKMEQALQTEACE